MGREKTKGEQHRQEQAHSAVDVPWRGQGNVWDQSNREMDEMREFLYEQRGEWEVMRAEAGYEPEDYYGDPPEEETAGGRAAMYEVCSSEQEIGGMVDGLIGIKDSYALRRADRHMINAVCGLLESATAVVDEPAAVDEALDAADSELDALLEREFGGEVEGDGPDLY